MYVHIAIIVHTFMATRVTASPACIDTGSLSSKPLYILISPSEPQVNKCLKRKNN